MGFSNCLSCVGFLLVSLQVRQVGLAEASFFIQTEMLFQRKVRWLLLQFLPFSEESCRRVRECVSVSGVYTLSSLIRSEEKKEA